MKKNNYYEYIGVKQATKTGYIKMAVPGVADFSYPTSEFRRGRVQGGGHISPTIMSGGGMVCKVIRWRKK